MKLNNLKDIKNIDELVKYNSLLLKEANKITRFNSFLAQELLQDTYIKLMRAFDNNRVINGGYIYSVMQSKYMDYKRHKPLVEFNEVTHESGYEDDEIRDLYEEEYEIENKLLKLDEQINDLHWYEKRVLDFEMSNDIKLSEVSRRSTIPYMALVRTKNKVINKLKDLNNE